MTVCSWHLDTSIFNFSAKKIRVTRLPNATTHHVDIIILNYIYSQPTQSEAKNRTLLHYFTCCIQFIDLNSY